MALQATKAKQAQPPQAASKTRARPSATPAKQAAPQKAAKPAAADAPKKAAGTVTLKAVFERLAAQHDMPKKQAHAMAAEMVELVTGILKAGDRVRMSGLGIIEVKDRPARTGRNPATGAAIEIGPSKRVAFRVAKELREAM